MQNLVKKALGFKSAVAMFLVMLATNLSFAEGTGSAASALATEAKTQLGDLTDAIQTIGLAIIGIAALIAVVMIIKRLVRGA